MKVTPGEIVLYSVGIDRVDKSGLDPDDRTMPDIVVRLKAGLSGNK